MKPVNRRDLRGASISRRHQNAACSCDVDGQNVKIKNSFRKGMAGLWNWATMVKDSLRYMNAKVGRDRGQWPRPFASAPADPTDVQ